jgi:hypothetical protein
VADGGALRFAARRQQCSLRSWRWAASKGRGAWAVSRSAARLRRSEYECDYPPAFFTNRGPGGSVAADAQPGGMAAPHAGLAKAEPRAISGCHLVLLVLAPARRSAGAPTRAAHAGCGSRRRPLAGAGGGVAADGGSGCRREARKRPPASLSAQGWARKAGGRASRRRSGRGHGAGHGPRTAGFDDRLL